MDDTVEKGVPAHIPLNHRPPDEQPREKLLNRGPQSLSDAELLAIFLRTGVKGRSAIDLARDLLDEFDGLRGLFNADETRFCEAKGLGRAKFAQLGAVLEMSRRHLEEELKRGDVLTDALSTKQFLRARLRDLPHEVFACLLLDNRHRVLRYEELFRGSISGASVHPREVVKLALATNAAAIIFAHNHPSGVAEPSQADIAITSRLQDALGLVEVRVLDHIIVGDGEPTSFAERGML